ncbi:unnamed protein product [Rotaria sp. Silwood1]|nr:unnamed protein product [Rotaria sp. Silwood1]
MQKVSNKDKLWDVINQFDHDKDGLIEADEIFKITFDQIIKQSINNIQLNVFYEYFSDDQEQIDSYLLKYFESARNLLINDEQTEKTKPYLKIILEYSWEKFNRGI